MEMWARIEGRRLPVWRWAFKMYVQFSVHCNVHTDSTEKHSYAAIHICNGERSKVPIIASVPLPGFINRFRNHHIHIQGPGKRAFLIDILLPERKLKSRHVGDRESFFLIVISAIISLVAEIARAV